MNKNTVKKLVQEGKTKEAISTLKGLVIGKEMGHFISIIEAEFNTLNQEILRGTIDTEQKQLRTNRINDKLLTLLDHDVTKVKKDSSRKKILLLLIPISLLVLTGLYFYLSNNSIADCPQFKQTSINKILLIPFENVGNETAKPHIVLRDRIHELANKKDLSTSIKLGSAKENLSIDDAPKLAASCDANVIIWGKYSNASDSLRLILQYYFLDHPEWSETSDLVTLKDVTSIQNGTMLKNLEDAIMSLCSIIAIRQEKKELTKKWLNKIEHKEGIDLKLIEVLN